MGVALEEYHVSKHNSCEQLFKVAVKRLRAPHNMKPSNKLRNSNVF